MQRDGVVNAAGNAPLLQLLWQLRRDQTNDHRLLAADAYAVDRLVLRGIPRLQAVEALGQALHVEARLEGRSGNDLLDMLRYQNLKRLAQRPAEDIVLS
jgi:autonomous glycyl radical cofactor GrcA